MVRKQNNRKLPYYRRGQLLSQGELAFFNALKRAIAGRYLIAPKVRAADLIHCSKDAWEEGFGHYVARHHLDFVLCDRISTQILAAIELDDRSHRLRRRKGRDEFLDQAFAAANVPLIRIQARSRYDINSIAETLTRKLSTNSTSSCSVDSNADCLQSITGGR